MGIELFTDVRTFVRVIMFVLGVFSVLVFGAILGCTHKRYGNPVHITEAPLMILVILHIAYLWINWRVGMVVLVVNLMNMIISLLIPDVWLHRRHANMYIGVYFLVLAFATCAFAVPILT